MLGCVTDGGYAVPGTACVDSWSYAGVAYKGCVSTNIASPFVGLVSIPSLPSNGATTDYWCPTISAYYPKSLTLQKKWGYCNCLPGGGTKSPTTASPTTESQRTCIEGNWSKEDCENIDGCQYYTEWKFAYGKSIPYWNRERIGCNYKRVCNIFKSDDECLKYKYLCMWGSNNQCIIKTPSPTTSPTIEFINFCLDKVESECSKTNGCNWFAPTVCSDTTGCNSYSYGCQLSSFCEFNQGILRGKQCSTNPNYCKFDLPRNLCYQMKPTSNPTVKPITAFPSGSPTKNPSLKPTTSTPTSNPTKSPTTTPSLSPTKTPTKSPTKFPVNAPTSKPSKNPTDTPSTIAPTKSPTQSLCFVGNTSKDACASVQPNGICAWKSIRACIGNQCVITDYGCQSYAFCGYNKGFAQSVQCNQNSDYCMWNSSTAKCEDKCDKPALITKRTLCDTFILGDPKSLDGKKALRVVDTKGNMNYIGLSLSGKPGDFNGDGYIDLVIGAPESEPKIPERPGTGAIYVLFGPFDASMKTLDLFDRVDGKNGVRINGTGLEALAGSSVAFIGDVNGDSIDDLLIGSETASTGTLNDNGEAYIVYGRKSFPASTNLSSLTKKTGVRIPGLADVSRLGTSVAWLGDVNGDGINDFVVSARDGSPIGRPRAGISYVIFGDKNFPQTFDLATLNGQNGFPIYGAKSFDYSGTMVGPAGDVNSDGYNDVVVGAPWADHPVTGLAGTGYVYVIFGGAAGFHPSTGIDLLKDLGADDTTIAATKYGFKIRGISYQWGQLGSSISPRPGDLDGDGIDDLLFAAPLATPNNKISAGEVYIVTGRKQFKATIDLLTDLDGTNGYRLIGEKSGDQAGFSVSIVGDVNADGWDDIAIGSPQATVDDKKFSGKAYVVYGRCKKQAPQTGQASLALLTKDQGITLLGNGIGYTLGTRVSSAGDLNGDGFEDVIIAAPSADLSSNIIDAGIVFTLFSC